MTADQTSVGRAADLMREALGILDGVGDWIPAAHLCMALELLEPGATPDPPGLSTDDGTSRTAGPSPWG
jgi:hypothetical protein